MPLHFAQKQTAQCYQKAALVPYLLLPYQILCRPQTLEPIKVLLLVYFLLWKL